MRPAEIQNDSFGGDPVIGQSHHGWSPDENSTESHLDSKSLYAHNPPPHTILFIFVTVLIGVFMRLLQRFFFVSSTVIIMILGIVYGLLAVTVYRPLSDYTAITRIDPHWILQIFLPILIFESSFTINFQLFRKSVGQILILATGGLALATCLTATMVKYTFNYGWNWCASLMFGALISATDPVAVVALLKDVGASAELSVVLEGESFLNDGTAIIFFNIFLAINTIPDDEFSAESLAVQSVLTVAGGPLFGFVCGSIVSWIIGRISNDAIAEVSVTLASAYLTFYISEALLNVSGVLAVVVLGLVLNYERTVISPQVEPWMHEFWSTLTYIANTLIFAVVGLTISEHALLNFTKSDWINLLLLYGGVILIRVTSIVAFLPLIRYAQPDNQACNWRNVLVMGWGGLRGAVSLALAMTVSRDPRLDQVTIGDKVLIHTAGIVMLTLFVNGTTTAKLLSLLGMRRIAEQAITAVGNALHHIGRNRQREIAVLQTDHFFDEVNWLDIMTETELKNPYRKESKPTNNTSVASLEICSTDLELGIPQIGSEMSVDTEADFRTTCLIWLKLLQHSFREQFEKGLICRQTLRYLFKCTEKSLEHGQDLVDADVITARFSIGQKLTYCQKILNKLIGHNTGSLRADDPNTTKTCDRHKAYMSASWSARIVESGWFTVLVYMTITVHVTAAIVNLALNWHGHHLHENFFHENIYFVAANGVFCLIYGSEMGLSIIAFGFLGYFSKHWNKLEIVIFAILLVDFILDIYVLAYGDKGSHIHQHMLRFFDVLSLLRILRAIRLVKLVFPMMGKFMEGLVTHRLLSGFDIGQAFMTGQEEATNWTALYVHNPTTLNRLKIVTDVAHHKVLRDLGILLEERPDIARAVKKRYASRKIIHHMRKDLHELRTRGLIEEKAASILQNELQKKIEKASTIPYRTINPDDILRRIPWMKNNHQLRKYLLNKAVPSKFAKQDLLISGGQQVSGIYIILSGIVKAFPSLKPVEFGMDFTNKSLFSSGETIGEYFFLTEKPSPTSFICRTAVQILCLASDVVQEATEKFGGLVQEIWEYTGLKMTTSLLAAQSPFRRQPYNKILKRVSKGAVIIIKDDIFNLLPDWELVVLLHGSCIALPQDMTMEGPKIMPPDTHSLHFNFSDFNTDVKGGRFPRIAVLFVLGHEAVFRTTTSLDDQTGVYHKSFQTHHV